VVRRQVGQQLKQPRRLHLQLRRAQMLGRRRVVQMLSLQLRVGQVRREQQVAQRRLLQQLLLGKINRQRGLQLRVVRQRRQHLPSSRPSSSSRL
jgi:hypothetical protein